jgi:plastocyanin
VTIEARSAPYVFAPSAKTIHVGDTVVWTIKPGDAHTITSGTIVGGIQVPDGKFDSGVEAPGQSFSHKFTTAGTYSYYCQIHADSGMNGTIRVVAASPTPKPTTNPAPRPTLRPTPRPTTAATSAATPTPNPTEARTAKPTASQSPAPVAAISAAPTASLTATSIATPSSVGSDVTPAPDVAPLVGAGILVGIAILGAIAVRARRND